ncbi:MAG: DUF559 domain-containing protein [Acidimicrobiia bacterium]
MTERQHGVFTGAQFLEAGFTRHQLRYRIRSGEILAVDYGVYRHAGTPSSSEQRLMAACLAGPAVASHRSAGRIWDFPGMPDRLLEVTALRHRRRRVADVTWHESFHLEERDVTEIDGIPVTRPVRTFLDLAGVLSQDHLEEVLNEGIRRNLLSIPAIWRRLEQLGALRPGAGRARRVLETHVPGQRPPDGVLETRYLQLIRSAGLDSGIGQYKVELPGGRLAFIDFAYPEVLLAVELDGDASHFGARRSRSDQTRENKLQALGWRVLRFDWDDVNRRRDYVVQTMRVALRATA